MRPPCARPPRRLLRVSSIAFIIALAMPFAQSSAGAEIPHENYDLMDSDLAVVIAMLNASVRASEDALRCFYDEDVDTADAYLDMVASVLEPAEAALGDIDDVAESYDQLSALLPPFVGLHTEMTGFSGLEGQLIDVRDEIIGVAATTNLSELEAVATLDSIRLVNSILARMNTTIDNMLIHAVEIDSLTVDNRTPFVPNELAALIDVLRGLTLRLHEEISDLMEEDMPWEDDRSFLIIWVEEADVYLGEEVRGGGYLMVNGSFVADNAVSILIDDVEVRSAFTTDVGSFVFNFTVPVNESWLGAHDLVASSNVSNVSMTSDVALVTVSLIPTSLVLSVDSQVISASESVAMSAELDDVRGLPVATSLCVLLADGAEHEFGTDPDGRMDWSWTGSSLGFGVHEFVARYLGELPYAPCESGNLTVVVDIPTELTLHLSSDRLNVGDDLQGECTLTANGSTPLANQKISLSIDGIAVANFSTDGLGVVTFSLNTDDIVAGTHLLSAEFIDMDPVWRHSDDEAVFILLDATQGEHPFFPWIPGWDIGGDLVDQIRNLFFGEYAYLTWLFVILVVAVVVKAIQMRKRRALSELSTERVNKAEERWGVIPWSGRGSLSATEQMPAWLTGANEKIIWYYHSLLAFLKTRARVGVADNMTHWEVAHLLEALGYPLGDAGRMAFLYEKARYSGAGSTEADVDLMRSAAETIRDSGGVRSAV